MPQIAVNTRGDSIRTMHTTRKAIRHIPLMARSSMLCGVNDQVKHTCTIGSPIHSIKSKHIDGTMHVKMVWIKRELDNIF